VSASHILIAHQPPVLPFQRELLGCVIAVLDARRREPYVMSEKLEREVTRTVSLDSAFVAVTCALLLYAVSWVMGCATAPPHDSGGRKKLTSTREAIKLSPEDANDKLVPTVSGRKLTVEKMAQRAATSLQYSNEEYGVAFDAPKGYLLKEGDLPEMDRGLGYLGPIPMHFAQPGGIRLATVEPPQGFISAPIS